MDGGTGYYSLLPPGVHAFQPGFSAQRGLRPKGIKEESSLEEPSGLKELKEILVPGWPSGTARVVYWPWGTAVYPVVCNIL